jgi:hypothetical protein
MHPRLAELVDYAQLQRTELLRAVALVPETLRARPVVCSAWSVAEVLEHLHRVESGIARLVSRGIERARAGGAEVERDDSSVLGSLDAFALAQRGSISAPEAVMPRGDLTATEALLALDGSRQSLVAAIRAGNGLALGAITYPHPILGTLNLYQWILFVGQHEARHADQVRRIAAELSSQAESTE